MIYSFVLFLVFVASVSGKVYLKEDFNDAGWKSRWVVPTEWRSKDELGDWAWTAGKYPGEGNENDKGIQTSEDARFYGLSAKLSEPFTNTGKDLVLQFVVKHEQDLDCGGAYIKLLGNMDQKKFGGDTPYQIMFGPDICGSMNRRTHVIFNYPPKNDNLLIKKDVKVETDRLSHLYTLHVKQDGTFEVLIDGESARSGKLEEEFDFLLPREIKDPNVSKPADWVDVKMIPDPTDVKPAGFDDVPKEIPDPEAKKPEDWDDEEDGEWEAPMIDNPEYKGAWSPRMIENPAYQGEWVHPLIPNPDFVEDKNLAVRCKECTHVGFELWQVKTGTMFDDIVVTDSIEEAKKYADETFWKRIKAEKEAWKKYDDEQRKTQEAADKAAADATKGDGDDEEEGHDEL